MECIIGKFIVLSCMFCKLQRNFGFFCSISHPYTHTKLSYSWSVYLNIRHSYEGQLTAVKLEHPLTIIAWLYCGLIYQLQGWSHICFKFSADILFDQGLNFVFLELETFIRHGYLHTWFVQEWSKWLKECIYCHLKHWPCQEYVFVLLQIIWWGNNIITGCSEPDVSLRNLNRNWSLGSWLINRYSILLDIILLID